MRPRRGAYTGRVVLVRDAIRAREVAATAGDVVLLWCWTSAGLLTREPLRSSAALLPPVDLALVDQDLAPEVWNEALFAPLVAVWEPVSLTAGAGEAFAGVARRVGRRAVPLALEERIVSHRMVELGLAELVVAAGTDPLEWLREWVGERSIPALASATFLLRNRLAGGILERFEFARLFSTGEPQEGLRRFLTKQPLDFSATTEWEIA